MNKLYLPILLGTAREGRQSEKAANYILKQAEGQEFETELLDVRDFVGTGVTQGMEEAAAKNWSDIMTRADGLIIVAPEYNNGYPGELKLMIDQIYDEYAGKAVAICGVSAGMIAGARVVKQLVSIAHQLKLQPIRNALYFPKIQDAFDDAGVPTDTGLEKRTQGMFDDLVWLASALKAAREA